MKLLKCSVVLSVVFLIALSSCQQSIDKIDTSKTLPYQDTVLFPKLVFVESIIKE